ATDADQARRFGTAAYIAASVNGDLNAAEALLADAWRASPDLLPPAETALATRFVLLHGDGDFTGAPRALLHHMPTPGDDGSAAHDMQDSLWLLAYVCRLGGNPEHWEALERFLRRPDPAFPAEIQPVIRAALDPKVALGQLSEDIESLAHRGEPAEVIRIG